jgi:hypothetical protein
MKVAIYPLRSHPMTSVKLPPTPAQLNTQDRVFLDLAQQRWETEGPKQKLDSAEVDPGEMRYITTFSDKGGQAKNVYAFTNLGKDGGMLDVPHLVIEDRFKGGEFWDLGPGPIVEPDGFGKPGSGPTGALETSLHPATFDSEIRGRGTKFFQDLHTSRSAEGKKTPISQPPAGLDTSLGILLTHPDLQDFSRTAFVHEGHVYVQEILGEGVFETRWFALGSVI